MATTRILVGGTNQASLRAAAELLGNAHHARHARHGIDTMIFFIQGLGIVRIWHAGAYSIAFLPGSSSYENQILDDTFCAPSCEASWEASWQGG